MRGSLIGISLLVTVGILVGCQEDSSQSGEIEDLKNQLEELQTENESLRNKVEEQKDLTENANQGEQQEASSGSESYNESIIFPETIDEYPQSLYKEETFDIDGDGEEEVIELYVNAGKTEDGLFAWDDGQTWLLVVQDGEKSYPIYDGFVQLGRIDFKIANLDSEPSVVMIETWHEDINIEKITYNEEEQGYLTEIIYKKINPNPRHNNPTSYAFFEDAYGLVETVFTEKAKTVLEASEEELQNRDKRFSMVDPLTMELYEAENYFEIIKELNPNLYISVEPAARFISQMSVNEPTQEQLNQLKSLHELFLESNQNEWILKEENKIHPDIQEKIQSMEEILN